MASSSALSRPPAATGLDVRAFRALTYRNADPDRLARVSSPAYDLVSADGRERLAAADPHNIVRLILPHVEPGAGNPDRTGRRTSAEQAAHTLHAWQAEGVLTRSAQPGLWRYEMTGPGTVATTGWIGAVALPPPGSSAVLPHEDTFAGAVEGRRALLAATRTDLEPIVLAHDPDDEVAELTRATGIAAPTMEVSDVDGVTHRLWQVTDPAVLDRLSGALTRTGAVIADGHHRFAAARAHHGSGSPDSDSILALLTPMGAGGLRVQAIHRVLPELSLEDAVAGAGRGFAGCRPLPAPDGLTAAIASWIDAPTGSGFLLTDGVSLVAVDRPTPETLARVPAGEPAPWRGLDVVLAHHGLIAGLWQRTDDLSSVLVAHDVPAAVQMARAQHGVALLLRSPSPADVAAVARAGARMPRKSTLFVPKPRTGLVLRPHGA